MFISVLFANGRWPRGEDVSVSQSRQSCDRRLGRAAVQPCMVLGSAPKLRGVVLRQTR